MNKEKFLVKGVKRHFNGEEVLFEVESLNAHYDGIEIHEVDLISIGEVEFIKANDVNMSNAIPKEVLEEVVAPLGMTYEEAEVAMGNGSLVALPEWGGFHFFDSKKEQVFVLTKEGEITETPFDEFKERNDWITVEPTEEQIQIVKDYFEKLEEVNAPLNQDEIEVAATDETQNYNPELLDKEVLEVETTLDSTEPVVENKAEELAPEPIAETPAPKKKKTTTKK